MEMKEEYKDFIGIYDESVPVELCEEFVKNYEKAKRDRTFIDASENEKTIQFKKDEVAFVAPLYSTIFPVPPVQKYFDYLNKCVKCYLQTYDINFKGILFNDVFKIHKVRKSEGFHEWHHERATPENAHRIMAYLTYLEVPEEGGETEFLHQSLRLDPIVGRTLIWPAGYTHMHRGNPPLVGEKMYIDGWFTAATSTFDDGNSK